MWLYLFYSHTLIYLVYVTNLFTSLPPPFLLPQPCSVFQQSYPVSLSSKTLIPKSQFHPKFNIISHLFDAI
ncbi:hypothetical protein HanPI659440_Chr04g0149901 [Helianthus annuus]|uniref:Uncharacterized protein n=1 Tax=Helianthus annuus TaxID=4232 RepID=A0A251USU0_HELAN|nr:hypothetical protein HanXRQr2_Chr03g0127051 [Helianthus annuus]KAJ0795386.1 hypothetical protein HanPI659440_Chr04g0149901 [Helianthus annuus]KAJ0945049.1 hypothetical protein HanPSC8_Chr03g0123641 [Helianthus annuus]